MVFGRQLQDYGEEPEISFNSPWELDGVRTRSRTGSNQDGGDYFQFPLGIRWCSDISLSLQFPAISSFNSPWELDGVRTSKGENRIPRQRAFNSPWELDGVRTKGKEVSS